MSRAVRAPRSGTSARGTGRVARWGVWFRRLLTILLFLLVPLPLFFLLVFRFVPVPITPEILLKRATLQPTHQRWEPYAAISPSLARAVIASEDENFCRHYGFDFKSIDDALKNHR